MSPKTIQVVEQGSVCHLRFNRPERLNTVTSQMVEEVHAALTTISAREDIRIVVLTGNGRAFCPGADLQVDPDRQPRLPAKDAYQSSTLLVEMPQITIAAINGGCAGAGLSWAAACDLRVASETARFAVAFLEAGVAGDLGLAWTLQRAVGGARARELFLLPRKFGAAEALSMALVSRVYPADQFEAGVSDLIDELCSRDLTALRHIKTNLIDAEKLPVREYIDIETSRHLSRFSQGAASATLDHFAARGRSL